MRKCFSMLLGAGIIALLTSCNFVATPNDGELAKDGLNHYVDWSSGTGGGGSGGGDIGTGGGATTSKFWKDWQPFVGIQVWGCGPSEGWGQEPLIDLVAGTISATKSTPAVMFPIFGAFDDSGSALIGTYDYSAVKKFSFKIKANKGTNNEVTLGTYFTTTDASATERPLTVTTEFQEVVVNVSEGKSNGYIFFLNCAVADADYVVTVNDVAFYDADGNQIKDLVMTPTN